MGVGGPHMEGTAVVCVVAGCVWVALAEVYDVLS